MNSLQALGLISNIYNFRISQRGGQWSKAEFVGKDAERPRSSEGLRRRSVMENDRNECNFRAEFGGRGAGQGGVETKI